MTWQVFLWILGKISIFVAVIQIKNDYGNFNHRVEQQENLFYHQRIGRIGIIAYRKAKAASKQRSRFTIQLHQQRTSSNDE